MKMKKLSVGLACVASAVLACNPVAAQKVNVTIALGNTTTQTTQSSTQSFVVNGGSISSTTYRANCYPYNNTPIYVYPNGYGYGGGYNNNGNVVVIGNGTTVINNPQPYSYGYPYGYYGAPIVVGSQYNTLGINGFSAGFGRGGINYNANIGNVPTYSTFAPSGLPASSYYYDPSIPSNWNNAPNYGNYNDNYVTYGVASAQRNSNNRNSTTSANNVNAANTDATSTSANANRFSNTANVGNANVSAQENTTWSNSAGWSLSDKETTIPSWTKDETASNEATPQAATK